MKHIPFPILFLALFFLLLVACSSDNLAEDAAATVTESSTTSDAAANDTPRPASWSDESHSNEVDPNYEVVFPQDKVNQMTITIDPTSWAAMQADMTELLGEPGTRGGPGGFGGPGPGGNPGQPPAGFDPDNPPAPPEGGFPSGGFPGGGAGMPGGGDFTSENPMWVAATITFEGQTWTNVGVRYKGNSSLQDAWNSESLKLPLKLDFYEFEDEVPAINNQRLYGVKQLSLANGLA